MAIRIAVTTMITVVAGLMILGLLTLYSAGMQTKGMQFLQMQAIWGTGGIIFAVIASRIDYRKYRALTPWFAALVVVLLALVLIPGIGVKKNGARRWFDLGVMSVQPSELAKLALIFTLALCMERWQRYQHTWVRGCLLPSLVAGLFVGLVFIEPDRGTAMLMAGVAGAIFFIGGMRFRALALLVSLGVAALTVSMINDPMRMGRIMSWAQPELHREGPGYQAWQASIALGAGGTTGVGLGNGRQKLGFVPEHHTDFIFSVVGEELGLAATLGVTTAFLLFGIAGFYIAHRTRDTFGLLVGIGLTTLITAQALFNIAVVTGSVPNKGLPLPFMSYGGSNLVLMLSCVGVLVGMARVANETDEVEPAQERMLALEEAPAT